MFGVYRVGPCIGEGGMARIYQAEHGGLQRQVALKVLIDDFARHPEARERFLREARVAAAVKHPNVVNIFDVGIHENIPYMVMELLEGQDLEQLLDWRGALDENLIIDIMVPVLAGLWAVHEAGIVHRDLKPGNIFLARGRYNDLEPKLLDFGICKAAGHDQLKLTAERMLIGTPLYVAPEGLLGVETTPLSDQYALGVVMYECATGCAPFSAPTLNELSRMIVSGQYVPPNARKPELSRRLAAIIERAMNREPHRRFPDLRAMGRELLLLADQRTRLTWGLSFGHSGQVVHTLPSMTSARPGPRTSSLRSLLGNVRPPSGGTLLAMATLLALAIALIILFPHTAGPPVFSPGLVTAHAPVTAQGASATEPRPPSAVSIPPVVAGATNPPASDPPATVPVSALPSARPQTQEAPPVAENAPRREARPPARPSTEPVAARKAPRSASTVAAAASSASSSAKAPAAEPDPEWALPAIRTTPRRPAPDDVRFGPNQAPILN